MEANALWHSGNELIQEEFHRFLIIEPLRHYAEGKREAY
jgi:hypothetical protein